MIKINYRSGVPICDQIVNGFIKQRALGEIDNGYQLPSVRSLAIELCVNPNTVQKAYQSLESSGIIYTVKGKGSFVSDDESAHKAIKKAVENDFEKTSLLAFNRGLSKEDMIQIINRITKD